LREVPVLISPCRAKHFRPGFLRGIAPRIIEDLFPEPSQLCAGDMGESAKAMLAFSNGELDFRESNDVEFIF